MQKCERAKTAGISPPAVSSIGAVEAGYDDWQEDSSILIGPARCVSVAHSELPGVGEKIFGALTSLLRCLIRFQLSDLTFNDLPEGN